MSRSESSFSSQRTVVPQSGDALPDADSTPDLETLAERFAAEYRRGARPSVDEYAARFPDFADEILELFPALLFLEKGGDRDSLSNFSQSASRQGFALDGFDRLKNYRLVREIGRGGMGVVYEAWDESLERTVALKVMKIFPGEEAQTIKRFQREAKTAARLHHTNIVPVYGSDVVDDKFFYVMQLIDGVSLEQFLRAKEGEASRSIRSTTKKTSSFARLFAKKTERPRVSDDPFAETTPFPPTSNALPASASRPDAAPPKAPKKRRRAARPDLPRPNEPLLSVQLDGANYYRRVCDLGIQAAQGLEYAHQHDVVHRDVKPSNLVVDDDGVLWIADFGLAKQTNENDLTRQGQFVGTLRYMSPEALEGKFSPLSDVYSLGLTLYELLTFSPAFDEKTYSKLFGQVASGATPPPRKINPKIPRDLETIVLKALERSVEKRYQSAGELADDLRRFLDELPIRARRIGPIERALRWSRRNKLVAGLFASVGALLVAIFSVLSVGYVQTRALLAEKNAESRRAQTESTRARANLDLALDAFDDVFAALGKDADVNFHLFSETTSFGPPADAPSITESDARVLESLLDFYDGFVRANENEATLLLKSARAYAKISGLRKLLGHSNDADAAEKALEFYRLALDAAPADERAAIVLEKAAVLGVALAEGSGAKKPEKYEPACAEALAELAEIPDDSPLADARRNGTARLRFARAVLNVENVRRAFDRRLGFFEAPSFPAPTEEVAAAIQADFDAVSDYFDALRKAGVATTPERNFFVVKFYAVYSLWKATLGDADAAFSLQKKSLEAARFFALHYPNDSRSYVSTVLHNVFKARVDGELLGFETVGRPVEKGVSELYRAENQAIEAVDALVAKFPDSPQYAAFQIVVRVFFAKREALAQNRSEAESLLQKADELTSRYVANRRRRDALQFFGPLYAGYAEFLVAENRLDEAEEQIAKLEAAFQKLVEKPSETDLERVEKNRAEIERLRRFLAESRRSAPLRAADR